MPERYRSDNIPNVWTHVMTCGSTTNSTVISVAQPRSMTDWISPGYFTKRKRGEFLPVNPVNSVVKSLKAPIGTHEWIGRNPATLEVQAYSRITGSLSQAMMWTMGYTTPFATFPGYINPGPAQPDTSVLLTDALANARTAGFDLGTFVAELNKTVDTIRNVRERTFARAENIVHSRKGTIASRGLAGFAETWLEGRYGWRQLFFDLEAANESLIRLQTLTGPFNRAASRDEATETKVISTFGPAKILRHKPSGTMTSNNYTKAQGNITQSLTRRSAGGVIIRSLANDLAFIDPIVTTWEVIPFSFIVDWFANIGDALAAYSPFSTGQLLGAWTGTDNDRTTVFTCTPLDPDDSPSLVNSYQGPGSDVSIASARYRIRYVADPSFSVSVRINLNREKIADLASIFVLKYMRLLRNISKIARV